MRYGNTTCPTYRLKPSDGASEAINRMMIASLTAAQIDHLLFCAAHGWPNKRVEIFAVLGWSACRHVDGRNKDSSIIVTYDLGARMVTELVPLKIRSGNAHSRAYYQAVADGWWKERCGENRAPATAGEALKRFGDDLTMPKVVLVATHDRGTKREWRQVVGNGAPIRWVGGVA